MTYPHPEPAPPAVAAAAMPTIAMHVPAALAAPAGVAVPAGAPPPPPTRPVFDAEAALARSPDLADDILMAQAYAASGWFAGVKDAGQALVKIRLGRELGVGQTASLTSIDVIESSRGPRVQIRARLLLAMIRRSEDRDYRITELSNEAASIQILRRVDGRLVEEGAPVRFTAEDAKTADLGKKATYRQWPRNMYLARAATLAVTAHCPDVMHGMDFYAVDDEIVREPNPPRPRDVPVERVERVADARRIDVVGDIMTEAHRQAAAVAGVPPPAPSAPPPAADGGGAPPAVQAPASAPPPADASASSEAARYGTDAAGMPAATAADVEKWRAEDSSRPGDPGERPADPVAPGGEALPEGLADDGYMARVLATPNERLMAAAIAECPLDEPVPGDGVAATLHDIAAARLGDHVAVLGCWRHAGVSPTPDARPTARQARAFIACLPPAQAGS